MKKTILAVMAGLILLTGCSSSGYDARPIKENGKDCFQIQDKQSHYKALGTFCKVELQDK